MLVLVTGMQKTANLQVLHSILRKSIDFASRSHFWNDKRFFFLSYWIHRRSRTLPSPRAFSLPWSRAPIWEGAVERVFCLNAVAWMRNPAGLCMHRPVDQE